MRIEIGKTYTDGKSFIVVTSKNGNEVYYTTDKGEHYHCLKKGFRYSFREVKK